MGHFVYILQSEENGRCYIGESSDPERRLEHNNSTSTGFTARYRPWRRDVLTEEPVEAATAE